MYKKCTICKKEFLKNEDNFFYKKDKYKLIDGTFKNFLKCCSSCKRCHSIKKTEITRKKRCEELNCSLDEYNKKWKLEIGLKNRKFKEAFNHPKYKILLYNVNKGYIFSSIRQFEEDLKNNLFIRRRIKKITKIKIADDLLLSDLPKKERSSLEKEYRNTILTDGLVANRLGFKVSEISKDHIQTKRLIIQINKLLKNQ
jgi:hypothetical protein